MLLLSICPFVQCFVDILERPITCAVYLFGDFGKISCFNLLFLVFERYPLLVPLDLLDTLFKFIGCIVTL